MITMFKLQTEQGILKSNVSQTRHCQRLLNSG